MRFDLVPKKLDGLIKNFIDKEFGAIPNSLLLISVLFCCYSNGFSLEISISLNSCKYSNSDFIILKKSAITALSYG